MVKNRLLSVLSVILIIGLLAACAKAPAASESPSSSAPAASSAAPGASASDAPPAEKVKIKFSGWGDPQEKGVFEKLIADFEAKNPNIDVEYIHVPADYVGKMNTILAGGNAPDVFYVPDGDFGRWVSTGVLMNIQKFVDGTSINIGDMWESALVRYKYDGTNLGKGDLYALPKDIGPTVLYYNKELFDKDGVAHPSPDTPMNWDQLIETAQKLTKDTNGDGKIDQYGMGPLWWEGFVWGNGGEVLNEARTEFVLNSKEAADALQFASDIRNKFKVAPDTRATSAMSDGQMFETGKLGMIIGGRWNVPAYRNLPFDWDVAPLPTKEWAGWSGSVGFSIYAKSEQPEASFKLIEYLAGEEGQKLQSELGFAIPNFKSMANTDVFLQPDKKPKNAQVFLKAAEAERPGPWTYVPNNKWWDIVNQNLGQLWEGKKTAVDLMNEIKPQVDAALKEGNPHLFK